MEKRSGGLVSHRCGGTHHEPRVGGGFLGRNFAEKTFLSAPQLQVVFGLKGCQQRKAHIWFFQPVAYIPQELQPVAHGVPMAERTLRYTLDTVIQLQV